MLGIYVTGELFCDAPERILQLNDKLDSVTRRLVENGRIERVREIEYLFRTARDLNPIGHPFVGRMLTQRVARFSGQNERLRLNSCFLPRNEVAPVLLQHFVDHPVGNGELSYAGNVFDRR